MEGRRVCLLTGQYPPDTGGVGHSASRVAHALAEHGLSVHVLHFRKWPVPTALDASVDSSREGLVTVHRARVWHPDPRAASGADGRARSEAEVLTRYNREMFELVGRLQREHRFELLHGFFLYPAGFIATSAARFLGLPSIASIRGNDVGKYLFDPLRAGFVRSALRNADFVTSVATNLLELADRMAEPLAGRSRTILNSLEFDWEKPRARPALELSGPVIGTSGLIRYKKGLLYLFQALARLRERFPFTLLLAGDFFDAGEERIHRAQLEELGLRARTHITGRLSRDELLDHLQLFDVLVYPSLFAEGCPLSLLEAMALGRPLVASRSGAIPEMLGDGESGLLVEPGSSAQIEAALLRLLGDPGLRRRLGAAARERARELSPERERDAWLETYRTVLQSARGAGAARSGEPPLPRLAAGAHGH